jgi:hypothetical protein
MNIKSFASTNIGRTAFGVALLGTVAVVGLGAHAAFAAVPDSGSTDDHESDCAFIQDQYNQSFNDNVNAKPGSAAESKSLDRMLNTVQAWHDDGCDGDYGYIGESAAPASTPTPTAAQALRAHPAKLSVSR